MTKYAPTHARHSICLSLARPSPRLRLRFAALSDYYFSGQSQGTDSGALSDYSTAQDIGQYLKKRGRGGFRLFFTFHLMVAFF